jgi:hypothetical protein
MMQGGSRWWRLWQRQNGGKPQPSYKLSPSREALETAIPDAFMQVLFDNRFRAEGCCLRNLLPHFPLRCIAMEMDTRGDPALVFDTGFMFRLEIRFRV